MQSSTIPHVVYIHGAGASPKSFAMFRSQLPEHTMLDVSYNASKPLSSVIDEVCLLIDRPCHIISHSLGGIIGVACSQRHPTLVRTVSTLSTPFGGSETATRLSMLLPFNMFLKNIAPGNVTLRDIVEQGPAVPTLNIITTHSNNTLLGMFIPSPNDGVVTVSSQHALIGATQERFSLNHMEVLSDIRVISRVENFISAL